MNKIDRIYVINLERCPERLNHFKDECLRELTKEDHKKIEIYKAIDGLTYSFTDKEKEMFTNSNINFLNTETNYKCMANQLGHYYILKDMIKNNYKKCLIFQDDVRFKQGFRKDLQHIVSSLPDDSEIVWIGTHKTGAGSYFEDFPINDGNDNNLSFIKEKLATSFVNNHICRLRDDVNPCSLAYLVTYKGAQGFVDYIKRKNFEEATDANFNKYLRSKNVMYMSVPVLCTGNSKFKSEIFTDDDNAIARDMLELLEEI